MERARTRGVPVWSEIELGARLLPNPILGVTGTNGKTTTTELLGAVFRAAGRPVEVAGNVGRPLTSLVGSASPDAWVVCELSSFQLEDVHTLKPARRRSPQPRARPPRPARHVRALRGAQAPDLRATGGRGHRRRAARVRRRSRGRDARRVRGRRSAPGRAAHPRAAQPRERRRRDRRGASGGRSTTRRSPMRCRPSRASRTASSSSARSAACGT